MPRCASGDLCNSPELPVEGAGLPFLHACRVCSYNVHSSCAELLDEEETTTNGGGVLYVCRICAPALTARRNATDTAATATQEVKSSDDGNNNNSSNNKAATAGRPKKRLKKDNENVDDEPASIEECKDQHPSIQPPERLQSPYGPDNHRSSRYWHAFHVFNPKHEANIAAGYIHHSCCNVCGKIVKVDNGSTSNMKQHIRSHHKKLWTQMETLPAGSNARIKQDRHVPIDSDIDIGRKHPNIEPPTRLFSPYGPNSSKTSVFWKFFHLFTKCQENTAAGVEGCACCNLCGKAVKISAGSTSALSAHLIAHHKDHYGSLNYTKKSDNRKRRGPYNVSSKLTSEKNQSMQKLYRSVAIFCVQNDLPFSVIQDKSFQNIIKTVVSASKGISEIDLNRKTTIMREMDVKSQLMSTVTQHKSHLRRMLSEATSLIASTSHWVARKVGSNSAAQSFATFSVCFIDKKQFKVRILTLQTHAHQPCGESIHDLNSRLDQQWGLDLERQVPLALIDTDGVGNMFSNTMNSIYKTHSIKTIDLELQELAEIAFQARYFGDERNQDESPELRKARALTRLLAEPAFNKKLKDSQPLNQTVRTLDEALPVVPDAVKSWWSTYYMLTRLVKLRPSVGVLVSSGIIPPDKSLTHKDWIVLEDLISVLKPLANAIKSLKGAKYVSASLVPHILPKIRSDLAELTSAREGIALINREVIDCAKEMLEAFDRRFGDSFKKPLTSASTGLDKAFYFALLLDPRFKGLTGMPISDEHKEYMWKVLEEEMRRNETDFREMKTAAARDAAGTNPAAAAGAKAAKTPSGSKSPHKRSDSDDQDYFLRHFSHLEDDDTRVDGGGEDNKGAGQQDAKQKAEETNAASIVEESNEVHDIKTDCAREIAMYRQEKGLKIIDRETGQYSDPLRGWWKDRHQTCPLLWRLALIYLPVPPLSEAALMSDSPTDIIDSLVPQALIDSTPDLALEFIHDIVLMKVNTSRDDTFDYWFNI